MIQPFCSVYTKSYRAFDGQEEAEKAKPCLYFSDLKENFLPLEDSKTIYNPERDEATLKDLQLRRLCSTYQKSYCMSEGKKSMVIDPNNLDADEFMVHFNNYYAKKTQAVPRPLLTSRRVYGYCRFDNYYTGKSTYEDEIGREAYNYFKKDYDEGKSRLFRKKQKAMQRQRMSDEPRQEAKAEPKKEPQQEAKNDPQQESKPESTNGPQQESKPEPKKDPQRESKPELKKEPQQEVKPERKEDQTPMKRGSNKDQKICAVCCEKYGEFCCGKPHCEESGDGRQPEKDSA